MLGGLPSEIYRCSDKLFGPNYLYEFQQSVPNYFSRKSPILQAQNKQLVNRSLKETNIKHCKITCRFELDIGLGTAVSAVDTGPISVNK